MLVLPSRDQQEQPDHLRDHQQEAAISASSREHREVAPRPIANLCCAAVSITC